MEFFKSGLTSIIKLWLEGGCQETPEELWLEGGCQETPEEMFEIVKSEYQGRE